MRPDPDKSKRRLQSQRKAKAKQILLGVLFRPNWHRLPLVPLEARVMACRREAVRRVLSCAEWNALDAMRDRMHALQKFERATREARHG